MQYSVRHLRSQIFSINTSNETIDKKVYVLNQYFQSTTIRNYFLFPLGGAFCLPPPEDLPGFLLGQPAEPLPLLPVWFLPLLPRLPPERLLLDFAMGITSFLYRFLTSREHSRQNTIRL